MPVMALVYCEVVDGAMRCRRVRHCGGCGCFGVVPVERACEDGVVVETEQIQRGVEGLSGELCIFETAWKEVGDGAERAFDRSDLGGVVEEEVVVLLEERHGCRLRCQAVRHGWEMVEGRRAGKTVRPPCTGSDRVCLSLPARMRA